MKHFFLSDDLFGEKEIKISGSDFHYLARVRRLKKGDSFPGIDSKGNQYRLTVCGESRGQMLVEYQLEEQENREPEKEIILYQCLLKGQKFDLIVRQATEAGVTKIIPVESHFSIARLSTESGSGGFKLERWNRIIREAVQQCGRLSFPVIGEPVRLKDIHDQSNLKLFFHQDALENQSLHYYLASNPGKVSILVGPEGGLAAEEIDFLKSKAFSPVHLGFTTLRAETAALYAIAAVNIILFENSSWRLS